MDKYKIPYKIVFDDYLNDILQLNVATPDQLKLNRWLLLSVPFNNSMMNSSSDFDKTISFMLLNGLRELTKKTLEDKTGINFNVQFAVKVESVAYFIIITIGGITFSLICAIMTIRQIVQTYRSKSDILKIFTLMSIDEIKHVYNLYDVYLDHFDQGLEVFEKLQTNSAKKSKMGKQVKLSEDEFDERRYFNQSVTPEQHYGDLLKKTICVLTHQRQKDKNLTLNSNNGQQKNTSRLINSDFKIHQMKGSTVHHKHFKHSDLDQQQHIVDSKSPPANSNIYKDEFRRTNQSQQEQFRKSSKTSELLHGGGRGGSAKATHMSKKKEKGAAAGGGSSMEEERKSSGSSSSDSEYEHKVQAKKKEEKPAKAKEQTEKREFSSREDPKARQSLWCKLILVTIISILMCGYFGYVFGVYKEQLNELQLIHNSVPIFFQRYSSLLLSYAYLRERFINQNNFTTTELDYKLPSLEQKLSLSIDEHYHSASMVSDQTLSALLLSAPSILSPITAHFAALDSKSYCATLDHGRRTVLPSGVQVKTLTQQELNAFQGRRSEAYQREISTIITACHYAASENSINDLRHLRDAHQTDMSQEDYDRRTPLHIAVSNKNFEVVKFLIEECNVQINPVDRWGATPLSDAQSSPEIKAYLLSKGARLGKIVSYKKVAAEDSQDVYKLLYSAYYDDIKTLDILRQLGVDMNGKDYDGRTALHIAASEGRLKAVMYLTQYIGGLSTLDARGNDAFADAIRENHTDVVNFLVKQQMLYQNSTCSSFENGLFQQGLKQSIGAFQKKFTDMQIVLNSSITNYTILLEPGPFKTLFSAHELYMYESINQLIEAVVETSQIFWAYFSQIATLSYYIYLAFLLFTLLVLRRKLIKELTREVNRTRGILNMVPLSFFVQEPEAAQRVVEMMKKDS